MTYLDTLKALGERAKSKKWDDLGESTEALGDLLDLLGTIVAVLEAVDKARETCTGEVATFDGRFVSDTDADRIASIWDALDQLAKAVDDSGATIPGEQE